MARTPKGYTTRPVPMGDNSRPAVAPQPTPLKIVEAKPSKPGSNQSPPVPQLVGGRPKPERKPSGGGSGQVGGEIGHLGGNN